MTEEQKVKNRARTSRWYAKNSERVKANVQKWRDANPRKVLEYHWRYKGIKITYEEFEITFERQGRRCANQGCLSTTSDHTRNGKEVLWHLDHDHSTGKVRGILCRSCNLLLGHAKESPARLRGAANYLEEHHGPQA
jgi:hypothetical protein